MGQQLFGLFLTVVIVFFVHRHYKKSTYSAADLYATFWPRVFSSWADSLVLWPIGFAVFVVLNWIAIPKIFEIIAICFEVIVSSAYVVWMLARKGQTVGKRMTRIRVVDAQTGKKITLSQSLIRECVPVVFSLSLLVFNIYTITMRPDSQTSAEAAKAIVFGKQFWLATSIPLLWFLIEIVTMLTNEKRRALHDYIAGTVVIRINTEDAVTA